MKIVHLCLSCFFIDNYSYQENLLPKYHVKQGNDVTVIASLYTFGEDGMGYYLPRPSTYYDKNGFKVIRLGYKKPLFVYERLRRYVGFRDVLEQEAPDLIFIHGVSFADATIVRDYKETHPHTIVFADSHTDFINSGKNFLSRTVLHSIIWRHYAKVLEPLLEKCYGVTPLRCKFLKDVYHIRDEKISFLPMGIDDEIIPRNKKEVKAQVRSELGIQVTDRVIFTGGKIDKLKNTHILLDSLDLVKKEDLHLIICGVLTPEMSYLADVISERSKKVHYLGWCNAERVINCMIASDIACFPGTHSTLWEQSVGMGLPSIFKRWDDMEHVNVNGNCLFVKGEDPVELKDCIEELLNEGRREYYDQKAQEASKSFLYSEISKKAIEF